MPEKRCKIRIETGRTIHGAVPLLERSDGPLYLLYDDSVKHLAWSLASEMDFKTQIGVEGGEKVKSLGSVESIAAALMEAGAGRDATLVVLGGGAVCDAGAFTASIYKRGIKFVLIPTTLLAQVDAAIGGKTAVNSHGIKNPLGTFALPEFTYICPEPLRTLPPQQWRSGAAELLKTLLIRGEGYEEAVSLLAEELAGAAPEPERLHELIMRAAHIKAEIVSEDFLDKGPRRLLNLGHTFGHAIEALSVEKGSPILHGEAVAIGMILSARLAESPFADKLKGDLESLGLPTECPFPQEELLPLVVQDKKAEGGKIRFILLHGPGRIEEVSIEPELPVSHKPSRFFSVSKTALLMLSAFFAAFIITSCVDEHVPSYAGKWVYLDSEPDLGETYKESYVTVTDKFDYIFYDAPSGTTVRGSREDFTHKGFTITLTPDEKYGSQSYVAYLRYLKNNLMVVETSSVNGTATTIRFHRLEGSY